MEARIKAGNSPSAAVLEATGFVQEGYLKEEYYFNEKFYDSVIYSRLQSVSYTHLRAHETVLDLVCRLLLEKKTKHDIKQQRLLLTRYYNKITLIKHLT